MICEMNSNRKTKSAGKGTPGPLNTTQYVCHTNASKRFSPNLSRRPLVNETVVGAVGPSDCKVKVKVSTNSNVNYETECITTYNDYLQALMKKQIAEMKVKEHQQVLEDQLLIQKENLCRRQQTLRELKKDTESFKIKSEIMQMIDFLQESFNNFASVCDKYNVKSVLSRFKDSLTLECDMIVLRNIKSMENQEDYKQFISALEQCLIITEKIINSGRDFQQVHSLAENIRSLSDLIRSSQSSQCTISELEKKALYSFLQNMSDFFASRYSDPISV